MANKGGRKPNRIPVRFVGDEEEAKPAAGTPDESPTPEELGRQSSYDDSTEMGQRIETGETGESDTAGGPDPSELPRSRNNQDTTASHTEPEGKGGGGASGTAQEPPRNAAAGAGPQVAELIATRAELRRVEGELKKLSDERQEMNDRLARRQAEFDNFRKRTLKQQSHAVELAAQPVVARLLEVLDDFDLALMSAEQQPDFEKFRKGVELVYAKLRDALRAEGLERMQAEGTPFDPEQHEALMQTGEGEGELTVADVLRPGYTLKGRVIRPAGVRVHKG
jgi:molecular chaperone GrpE